MKFLCVSCDAAMKLRQTTSPQSGTLSAVFECPECFSQIAMLTNSSETQMVQSLGVKIGPSGEPGEAAKCPFSGVVAELEATPASGMSWTPEALARLANIPDFVRPMAKQGVEQFAQSQGHLVVDEAILDQARGKFGM